jgi:hypothetical protein
VVYFHGGGETIPILGLDFEANSGDKETFEGASFLMFFVFRLCASGAAKNVYTRGRKWICVGAVYWLDGHRGAGRVGGDRGRVDLSGCRARPQAREDEEGKARTGDEAATRPHPLRKAKPQRDGPPPILLTRLGCATRRHEVTPRKNLTRVKTLRAVTNSQRLDPRIAATVGSTTAAARTPNDM